MIESWANEKLQNVDDIVKAFSTRVSLRDIVVENGVEKYLTKTQDEMRALPHMECVEAALILNQSAVFIQLQINREQGRVSWAEKCVDRLIAKNVSNYGGTHTPYQYRRQMAIHDNEAALAIEAVRVNSQLCIDTISYVPGHIRAMASSYLELANAKRYKSDT